VLDNGELPSTLIREKPDWHMAEVVDPRNTDFYESDRALGFLYRNPNLSVEIPKEDGASQPVDVIDSIGIVMDPISVALAPIVESCLGEEADAEVNDDADSDAARLFRKYVNELSYIRSTHTISSRPDSQLQEAEIVVGTILDKCTQKRYRQDRMYRMRNHTETLVQDIERHFVDKSLQPGYSEWLVGLKGAWDAWNYSQRHYKEVGAGSFGLVALGIVLDCLDNVF
jgi:RNA-dependent RNA polymerase